MISVHTIICVEGSEACGTGQESTLALGSTLRICKQLGRTFDDCRGEPKANMPVNVPEKKDESGDLMEKGDKREFIVRAHIIEAKGLQEALRTSFSKTVGSTVLSPTVRVSWVKEEITSAGKIHEVVAVAHTKIRPKTSNPTYDELIVLKKHMTTEDFHNHSKVRFEILDANTWEREKVLSVYEFWIKDIREKNQNAAGSDEVGMRPYNPHGNEWRNVWFVMNKPNKNIQDSYSLGGFLRATVSACLHDEVPGESRNSNAAVRIRGPFLQPMYWDKSINFNRQRHKVMVRLYRGRGMPTGNLQLTFKYAGKVKRSTPLMKATDGENGSTKKMNATSSDPVWNEEIEIPYIKYGEQAHVESDLVISLQDLNHLSAEAKGPVAGVLRHGIAEDNLVARHRIPINSLLHLNEEEPNHKNIIKKIKSKENSTEKFSTELEKRGAKPFWINFYGSHEAGTQTPSIQSMNEGEVDGSDFKGRILVQMYVCPPTESSGSTEKDNQGKEERQISPCKYDKVDTFTLRVDLYEGYGFPDLLSQYNLEVQVELDGTKSSKLFGKVKQSEDGLIRTSEWYKQFPDLRVDLPRETNNIPDAFVYVYAEKQGKSERIGFLRLPLRTKQFPFNDNDPLWMPLQPDRWSTTYNKQSVPLQKNGLLGSKVVGNLNLRVGFGRTSLAQPIRAKLKVAKTHLWDLRAFVYQARDLPVETDLFPDSYVEISLGRAKGRTKVVPSSCYPRWYELVVLKNVPLILNPKAWRNDAEDLSQFAQTIKVSVKDEDQHMGDNLLGKFEVPLSEVSIITQDDVSSEEHLQTCKLNRGTTLAQELGRNWNSRERRIKANPPEKRSFKDAPTATKSDWWPLIPPLDGNGNEVALRHSENSHLLPRRDLLSKAQGGLLIWFQLIEKKIVKDIHLPKDITPLSQLCHIDMEIIGARNLLPIENHSIDRPYMVIDTGDSSEPTKVFRTKAGNGPNASYLESKRVALRLPEDPLFAPTMQIRCYDYRRAGAAKCPVGSAFVPLLKFYPDSWKFAGDYFSRKMKDEMLLEWKLANKLETSLRYEEQKRNNPVLARDQMLEEMDIEVRKELFQVLLKKNNFGATGKETSAYKKFRQKMISRQKTFMRSWNAMQKNEEATANLLGISKKVEAKSKSKSKKSYHSLDDDAYGKMEAGYDMSNAIGGDHKTLYVTPEALDPGTNPLMRAGETKEGAVMLKSDDPVTEAQKQRYRRKMKDGHFDYDPKSGFPIDKQTGYAMDPITGMRLDQFSMKYIDEYSNLPIDKETGFAQDPKTGLMIDPETKTIVSFRHLPQQVRLRESASDQRSARVGNDFLPNRRIETEYEKLPGMELPFDNIPLFRGIEETPEIGDKSYAGDINANFRVFTRGRLQEGSEPVNLKSKFKKTIVTVRVYVLHGINIVASPLEKRAMGAALANKNWQQRQRGNLYLRVKCGETQERLLSLNPHNNPTERHFEQQLKNEIAREYGCELNEKGDIEVKVHKSTMNPDFFTMIELDVKFPGPSKLEVQVWDHIQDLDSKRKRLNTNGKNAGLNSRTANVLKSALEHDVLVGSTKVDLERRWYSEEWKKLEYKPIEKRSLWCPTSLLSQGKIECWIDMWPKEIAQGKIPRHIESPKPEVFEFRMVLWSIVDIDFRHEKYIFDSMTRTKDKSLKDFYVRTTMRSGNVRDAKIGRLPSGWRSSMVTDTHFGLSFDSRNDEKKNTDFVEIGGENIGTDINFTAYEEKKRRELLEKGKFDRDKTVVEGAQAEFNWRFNWRVELPCQEPTIRLQLFDKVLAKGKLDTKEKRDKKRKRGYAVNVETDHWAEALVDVGDIMRTAIRSGKSISYGIPNSSGKEDSRLNYSNEPFRVKLFHRHFSNIQGYAYVSFQCIPLAFAQSMPAGQGRSSPNKGPKLETPGPTVCCKCKSRWCQGLKSRLTNCLSRKRTIFIIVLIATILFFLLLPLLQDSF